MPKRQIGQLLLFVFVDVIGYSLFFPLLPYYAAEFGAGAALVGLMIASNAAAQLLASPLVGRLSDRFGRRPLILVSIVGTLSSFLLLAFVEPLSGYLALNLDLVWSGQDQSTRAAGWAIVLLFFCRILDGAAGGNVSLARAYVSDITTDDQRAQGLGFIGAAFGFGFVIGPAIGGTLSNWPVGLHWTEQMALSRFATPAVAAAAISLVNLIGVFLLLPESLPPHRRALTAVRQAGAGFSALRHPGRRQLTRLLGLRLVFSLAITLLMANFALFTQHHVGLSDRATGYVMTYAGILLILVQAVGIRWLTKRHSEFGIIYYSTFVVAGSFLCLGLSFNIPSLLIILAPIALSGGVINTIVNSLISKSVEQDQVGRALGLATSAESLAWIVAPVIGGSLIDFCGGVVFAVIGAAIAASMIPYIRLSLGAGRARA